MSTTDAPPPIDMTNKNSYPMDYRCSNCFAIMSVRFEKGTLCPVYLKETICENCGCYCLQLDEKLDFGEGKIFKIQKSK